MVTLTESLEKLTLEIIGLKKQLSDSNERISKLETIVEATSSPSELNSNNSGKLILSELSQVRDYNDRSIQILDPKEAVVKNSIDRATELLIQYGRVLHL